MQRAGTFPVNNAVVRDETIVEAQVYFQSSDCKMDLPFVNVLCAQTSTQRSAGPLTALKTTAKCRRPPPQISRERVLPLQTFTMVIAHCGTKEMINPCLIHYTSSLWEGE